MVRLIAKGWPVVSDFPASRKAFSLWKTSAGGGYNS